MTSLVINKVKRTERGWPGHYCCAHYCLFHRNTLLEYNDIRIVVSTVGLKQNFDDGIIGYERISLNGYFETKTFHAQLEDGRWWDIDVAREINFDSPWVINELDADDKANDMHETVVDEITKKLEDGAIK